MRSVVEANSHANSRLQGSRSLPPKCEAVETQIGKNMAKAPKHCWSKKNRNNIDRLLYATISKLSWYQTGSAQTRGFQGAIFAMRKFVMLGGVFVRLTLIGHLQSRDFCISHVLKWQHFNDYGDWSNGQTAFARAHENFDEDVFTLESLYTASQVFAASNLRSVYPHGASERMSYVVPFRAKISRCTCSTTSRIHHHASKC